LGEDEYLINLNFVFNFSNKDLEKNINKITLNNNKSFYIKNVKLSFVDSYIGTIGWYQRFYVNSNVKRIPNKRSLYNIVIKKLDLVIRKLR